MKNLELPKLTEYIRKAVELETSVFQQESICQNARNTVTMPNVERKGPSKPVNKRDSQNKPEPPVYSSSNETKPAVFALFGTVVGIFVLLAIISLFIPSVMGTVFALICAVVFALPLGVAISKRAKEKNENEEKEFLYRTQLEQYEKACKDCDKEYERELVQYNSAMREVEKQYQNDVQEAQIVYAKAQDSVSQMENTLAETKNTLKKLYDLDVIFPKYRNLVAVSSFLEYLETGRCMELSGPNGAYNLYESELRQNLIIGQLGMVVNQLEEIKQNQFILYQELNTANNNITHINKLISCIMKATEQTAINSQIAAYCSEITAANTDYLASIVTFG